MNANRGYQGFSKSLNAVLAEENGEKPISKWGAADRDKFVADLKKAGKVKENFKLTVQEFKTFIKFECQSSWHHTSKFFNETNYYHPAAAFCWDFSDLFIPDRWIEEIDWEDSRARIALERLHQVALGAHPKYPENREALLTRIFGNRLVEQ